MKKVIITGSTGMVGKGVLLECLEDARIEKVLVINRHSLGMQNPKLKEVLLADFIKVAEIAEHLKGYDACFYCMGVSSLGLSETVFSAITFDPVVAFADVLHQLNPMLVFNYVSGVGTDSSTSSSTMWKNVKGRTENYILKKGFADAYMFRPGAIIPEKGIQSKTKLYNLLYVLSRPFFGIMKKSKNVTTTTNLGKAMINTLFYPQPLKHLENKEINKLASKNYNLAQQS